MRHSVSCNKGYHTLPIICQRICRCHCSNVRNVCITLSTISTADCMQSVPFCLKGITGLRKFQLANSLRSKISASRNPRLSITIKIASPIPLSPVTQWVCKFACKFSYKQWRLEGFIKGVSPLPRLFPSVT